MLLFRCGLPDTDQRYDDTYKSYKDTYNRNYNTDKTNSRFNHLIAMLPFVDFPYRSLLCIKGVLGKFIPAKGEPPAVIYG